MTREHKLALILGFAVVLAVGVLISDHLSSASASRLDTMAADAPGEGAGALPVIGATNESAPLASASFADVLRERFQEIETPPAVQTEEIAPAPTIGGALADASDEPFGAYGPGVPTIVMQARTDDSAGSVEARANDALATKTTGAVSRHVVQEGESLWGIAEQHYGDGRLYTKLATFNAGKVGADGELNEGATLLIPAREDLTRDPREVGSAAGAAGATKAPDAKGARTYTIREGDTLSEIAQKQLGSGRRWAEIYSLNKDVIDDPDVAPAGVTIRLPAR